MKFLDSLEVEIRSKPVRSAGAALATGFILSRLPIARIVAWLIRTAVPLIRPSLLIFGMAKALNIIPSRKPEIPQPAARGQFHETHESS